MWVFWKKQWKNPSFEQVMVKKGSSGRLPVATEMETKTLRRALGKVVGRREARPPGEWPRGLRDVVGPCRRPESSKRVGVQDASLP